MGDRAVVSMTSGLPVAVEPLIRSFDELPQAAAPRARTATAAMLPAIL